MNLFQDSKYNKDSKQEFGGVASGKNRGEYIAYVEAQANAGKPSVTFAEWVSGKR